MTYFIDNKSEKAEIPTGGTFSPSGFVSPWSAAVLYKFWSEIELDNELLDPALGAGSKRQTTNGFQYYFVDRELADTASKEVTEYGAQSVWHYETASQDVMNFASEDAREKFGASIGYDLRIATLGSKKYRHELHMLALPAAVNAMAKLLGYADGEDYPGFDLSELTDQNTVFSDEFQFKMIGNPDASAGDEDFYTESVLWQRRAKLWAYLGEDNPKAYRSEGSQSKFDTTSDKLSACLQVLEYSWAKPAYARVVPVQDPRYDAVGNNENRLSIPVIWEIFPDKASADEAAKVDVERMSGGDSDGGKKEVATPGGTPGGNPSIPTSWVEMDLTAEDWLKALGEVKAENPKLNRPKAAKIAKDLDATADDVEAWWDRV